MAMFKPLHTRRRRLVFSSSSHIRTKRGQESEIQFEKKKRLIIFTTSLGYPALPGMIQNRY